MILSREVKSEIESHFFNYQSDRFMIMQRGREIAEETASINETGIRCGVPDPTAQKVEKIENELQAMKDWVWVVEKTVEKFAGTFYEQIISLTYVEHFSPVKIAMLIPCSERSYYGWKKDIISYAALKASEKKLISV